MLELLITIGFNLCSSEEDEMKSQGLKILGIILYRFKDVVDPEDKTKLLVELYEA
jgi:hypothetical protein